MKRRNNSKIILGLLLAVIGLGIGYAAISGINLLVNGTATLKSSDGNFLVRFVKPIQSETAIESPVTNAITIIGHNADESVMDVSGMSASVEDDTHATFSAGSLDEVGEYVEFTYTVVNESDRLDAALSFDVEGENDAEDYFEITKTVSKEQIAKGETATVTVKVKLIDTPKVEDYEGTFTVTLTTTSEEPSEQGSSSSSVGGPKLVKAELGDTHKGIVYLDPTDLTADCDEESSVSLTGTKTGCMKWYIYGDSGDDYTMILDHNTTARISWYDSNINVPYESSNLKLAIDDLVTVSGWEVTPRLIAAPEIMSITENPTFNLLINDWYCLGSNTKDSESEPKCNASTNSNYAWLFDNTNNCTTYGCNSSDSSNNGYWTSTPVGNTYYVWFVYSNGSLNNYTAKSASAGVRPVITVDKSIFD